MPKTKENEVAAEAVPPQETPGDAHDAQAAADLAAAFDRPNTEVELHYPMLAGVATADLVSKIQGTGSFQASYINWSRTMQLLRQHAPGWLPEMMVAPDGGVLHLAPNGAFLLIRFVHADGRVTPPVPQAIMDSRNNSVAIEKITSRDLTDTHRRGVCMAAAFTFGLAYELWAKIDLESGYGTEETKPEVVREEPAAHMVHIKQAVDVATLRRAFALAWKQYEGDDAQQAKFKDAYDDRLNALAEE